MMQQPVEVLNSSATDTDRVLAMLESIDGKLDIALGVVTVVFILVFFVWLNQLAWRK